MQIDPTKWPKVECMFYPSTGVYWHVYFDGSVAAYQHKAGQSIVRSGGSDATHYGPIEFVPPKVIPPKPELVCIEADEAYLLKERIYWAIIDRFEKAWLKDTDGVVWCCRDYKIIDQ